MTIVDPPPARRFQPNPPAERAHFWLRGSAWFFTIAASLGILFIIVVLAMVAFGAMNNARGREMEQQLLAIAIALPAVGFSMFFAGLSWRFSSSP